MTPKHVDIDVQGTDMFGACFSESAKLGAGVQVVRPESVREKVRDEAEIILSSL